MRNMYLRELLVPEVKSINKRDRGEYQYIELGDEQFDKQMKLLHRFHDSKKPRVFLDVGCGIGAKLFIAAGWNCMNREKDRIVGIDNTPEYVKAAKKYRNTLAREYDYIKDIEVYLADALEYNYAGFNVVYFYRPISDNEQQQKLENRIHSTMDIGSLLLSNLPYYDYDDYYPDWDKSRNMPNNFKLLWADYDNKSFIHRKESD